MDKYEHLKRLSDLRDNGTLTEREFNIQKQLILTESPQPSKEKPSSPRPAAALLLGILNLFVSFSESCLRDSYYGALFGVFLLGSTGIVLCIASQRARERGIVLRLIAVGINAFAMINILLV
jgi:hypothetical protein